MASVEAALEEVAGEIDGADFEFYYTTPDLSAYSGKATQNFRNLFDYWDEFLTADVILYWGDFHQNLDYIDLTARRLVETGQASTVKTAHQMARRALLLSNQPDNIVQKAIGFGVSLLQNCQASYQDRDYTYDLQRLAQLTRFWMLRDPISAMTFTWLRGEDWPEGFGCDAALLLGTSKPTREVSERDATEQQSEGTVGVYFGRGNGRYLTKMRFALQLAEGSRSRVMWIPWMPDRGASKSRSFQFRYGRHLRSRGQAERPLTALFEEIEDCDLVVTDTYHLAVNSWRLGTPAVCTGHYVTNSSLDISSGRRHSWRDKRHLFYMMYGLEGFYVHDRELMESGLAKARREQILTLLHSPDAWQPFMWHLEHAQITHRSRLLDALV